MAVADLGNGWRSLVVLGCIALVAGCKPAVSRQPTGLVKARAAAKAPLPEGEVVWLVDVPADNAKVGWGAFEKNGTSWGPIGFNGMRCDHGLGPHPDSSVEYEIDKQFKAFYVGAAMDDSTGPGIDRDILFRVYGDDKLLWESAGLSKWQQMQPCVVDVTGVELLRLDIVYNPKHQGSGANAHGVWLDPRLSRAPANPEMLKLFSSDTGQRLTAALDYADKVFQAFEREDFEALEEMAEEARQSKELVAGAPKLSKFYDALTDYAQPKEDRRHQWFDRINRWHEQFPDKVTAYCVESRNRSLYAFDARSANDSRNVSGDRWAQYRERMRDVKRVLDEATAKNLVDAELLTRNIAYIRNVNGNHDEIDMAIERIMEIAPDYWPAYGMTADALLPRWGGQPGELEEFAAAVRDQLGGEPGDRAYAHAVKEILSYEQGREVLTRKFDNEALLRGAMAMLKDSPDDMSAVHFAARIACLARDRKLAGQLLEVVGPSSYWADYWGTIDRFVYSQRWADLHRAKSEALFTVTALTANVDHVAFLASGNRLVASSAAGEAMCLVDVATGEVIQGEEGPTSMRVTAHPTRELFARAGHVMQAGDRVVEICTVNDEGKITAKPAGPLIPSVTALGFSQNGEWLAVGGYYGQASMWRWEDEDEEFHDFNAGRPVRSATPSPDGSLLATGTFGGDLQIWNVAAGNLQKELHNDQVTTAFFKTPDELLVTAGKPAIGRLRLTDEDIAWEMSFDEPVWCAAVDPKNQWLAVGTLNGDVLLFDVATSELLHTFKGHWGMISCLAFSPDGTRLASGSADTEVHIWDVSAHRKKP